MSLEELYREAQETLPFVKLQDGESFEGKFISVEKAVGYKGKETNEYTFLVKDIEKTLQTSSFSLLSSMVAAGIKEGDMVRITRNGEGMSTKYKAYKVA